MVGFARAVSDGVALAYLADVYIVNDARGHGLGRRLVQTMVDDGPGAHFRWMLHTADAHGLYAQFGFTRPGETYLGRRSRRPPPSPCARPPGALPSRRVKLGKRADDVDSNHDGGT